jgi:hypothetical protein
VSQHYSDPKRANDPHALPDLDTFEVTQHTPTYECPLCSPLGVHRHDDDDDEEACDSSHAANHVGWYWQSCFPGCLPDGEPNGPFATEEEALADARNGMDDDDDDETGEEFTCRGCNQTLKARTADADGDLIDNYCQDCSVASGDGMTLDLQRAAVCAECCDCDEPIIDEPNEEDYYLSDDWRSIMYLGRVIVGPVSVDAEPCPRDAVMAALREYMHTIGYWPNVWAISDHGNASLISVLDCGCYFTEHDGDASKHAERCASCGLTNGGNVNCGECREWGRL